MNEYEKANLAYAVLVPSLLLSVLFFGWNI